MAEPLLRRAILRLLLLSVRVTAPLARYGHATTETQMIVSLVALETDALEQGRGVANSNPWTQIV